MDVAGDAIAVALDRALQLELFDLAAEPAGADEAHGAGDDEERGEAGRDLERARLVDVGRTTNGTAASTLLQRPSPWLAATRKR